MLKLLDSLLPANAVLVPRGSSVIRVSDLKEAHLEIPWSSERVEALGVLSNSILRHDQLRRDPAAVALGFWLRPANLRELKLGFPAELGAVRVPAGIVFHVTPANVDTMFMYSWALSFIAGNSNIVRLSSRISPLMNTFLGLLANLFATHESATAGNWFISYGHDDQVTAAFSSFCDLRIVWGGDETVRRIRAIPLNAHAAERAFASKRSISVLRTAAYLAADEVVRNKLADAMATDVIPFAQMACSSPHQVFWIGKVEDAAEAIVDFHQRLDCAICRRGANQEISHAVRRFNAAFALAASGQAAKVEFSARATSVVAASPEKSEQEIPCGAGLLLNASCTTWEEVRQLLRAEHQTVTHFGFTTGELQDMAWTAGIRGVDRLVPVGRALDFTPIWDGFSLWTDLTRSVVIR